MGLFHFRRARAKIDPDSFRMAAEEFEISKESPKKDSHKTLKYVIYILVVLIATGISLALSLTGTSKVGDVEHSNFSLIVQAFAEADWVYLMAMLGIVVISYIIDGFIIFIFCRLYTRRYKIHQGIATSLVGQFYSDVTPGASGGQVMQVYTMKSQGIIVSNAASIAVMWFILYQTALLIFDVVAFIVQRDAILGIEAIRIGGFELPMIPLIIVGFLLNLSVIFLLFTMSFWHGFHNFIINHVIGFLGKIRIVKKPEQTKENLRVQVENFKIELRRLSANIPVVILVLILFLLLLFCRFCAPYFAGMSLNAWEGYCTAETGCVKTPFSFQKMMEASFLGAFHQMVTGLLPLPGSAGVSELFYTLLFHNYFTTYNGAVLPAEKLGAVLGSTQILWRTATFHLPLLVSGVTAALYRSRPKEPIHYANRKTFIALTMSTMTERKASAETMYETRQMSRKQLQNKLQGGDAKTDKPPVIEVPNSETKLKPETPPKKPKAPRKSKKNEEDDGGEWESWSI